MIPKKLLLYPLIFGLLGAFIGLILRYAFTGAIPGFPFKNVLHSHSHVLLLGFIFNALLILVWTKFTSNIDKVSYRYYIAIQVCVSVMLVTFIVQGYGFFSILFSTLHLWLSYILLIRLWKRLNGNEAINQLIKVGIVFHFLSSLGPYVLGPLMVFEMKGSPLYEQAIFFYLHFQYFGVLFMWVLALLFERASVFFSKRHLVMITVSLLLLFAHSLDYSYDHWVINLVGGFGSILLLIVLLSFNRFYLKNESGVRYLYFILIFIAVMNVLGSFPGIANRVVDSRLLLIGWLHLLFLGFYVPVIWMFFKKNISPLIWTFYGIMFIITEIVLVFPGTISKYVPIPIMLLLFLTYLGVFISICFVHIPLLFERKSRLNQIK